MTTLELALNGAAIAVLFFLAFLGVIALLSYLPPPKRVRREIEQIATRQHQIRKHNLRRVK